MNFLYIALLFTAASPALAYSNSAVTSLSQLSTTTLQANDYINHLEGCGYKNTTQAIIAGAKPTAGSACPSADSAITDRLNSLTKSIQGSTASLHASRQSTESTSSQVVAAFNQFADAYYTLFNAMDLAECTYRLTTQSKSFGAQFGKHALLEAYNKMVAELSTNPVVALQVAGPDLKQQTHFAGTTLLATQVGGPFALEGCELITGIVTSEGGGSS